MIVDVSALLRFQQSNNVCRRYARQEKQSVFCGVLFFYFQKADRILCDASVTWVLFRCPRPQKLA